MHGFEHGRLTSAGVIFDNATFEKYGLTVVVFHMQFLDLADSRPRLWVLLLLWNAVSEPSFVQRQLSHSMRSPSWFLFPQTHYPNLTKKANPIVTPRRMGATARIRRLGDESAPSTPTNRDIVSLCSHAGAHTCCSSRSGGKKLSRRLSFPLVAWYRFLCTGILVLNIFGRF